MLKKKFQYLSLVTIVTISGISFSTAVNADLVSYSTGFESSPTTGLIGDGWNNYVNQFATDGSYAGGYEYVGGGAGGAPAGGPQVSAIVAGQTGPEQGLQALVVYSDYDNGFFMTNGNPAALETNVFQGQTVGAGDIGNTWRFSFDAKRGNIEAPATASAFIKVFDANFNLLSFPQYDTSDLSIDWGTYSIDLTMDPVYEGAILQFGFLTNTGGYVGSGNYYDNVNFALAPAVPVPAAVWLFGSGLLGLIGVARRRKAT